EIRSVPRIRRTLGAGATIGAISSVQSRSSVFPEKRPPRPTRFGTYDLEWFKHVYILRLAGTFDGCRYLHHVTSDGLPSIHGMLSYMFSPEHDGMRWYAHAGGLADISFLLEPLLEMGYQCEGAFSGSSVIMLKVTKGKHSWMHIDSFWTIRKKLADVGKIIGILKPEVDTDKCSMAELLDRNEQDCVILYRALQRLEDQLLQRGGELRITLASCALVIFRRGHLKSYIPRNEDANTWARAGYTASRVEVFRYQCTHADYYDI